MDPPKFRGSEPLISFIVLAPFFQSSLGGTFRFGNSAEPVFHIRRGCNFGGRDDQRQLGGCDRGRRDYFTRSVFSASLRV